MTQFGDAFLGFARVLGQKRDQMVNQAMALETTKQVNAFQEEAENHLQEATINNKDPFNFYDDQAEWYENRVSDFEDSIPDDRVRNKFREFTTRHKSVYNQRAFNAQLGNLKTYQLETADSNVASSVGRLSSADPSELDSVLEDTIIPGIDLTVDNSMAGIQDAVREKHGVVFQSYVDIKINALDEMLELKKISETEYRQGLDEIREKINGNPTFYKSLGGDKLRQYNNVISDRKTSGAKLVAARKRQQFAANLPGYALAVQEGEGLNPALHTEMREVFRGTAQFAQVDQTLKILESHDDLYQARNLGDYQTLLEIAKQDRDAFENSRATGQTRELQAKLYQESQKLVQESAELLSKNTRQFFDGNPQVALAESISQESGDFRPVVDAVAELAGSVGIDESRVYFLSDEELSQMFLTFQSGEEDGVENLARNLKNRYDIDFGNFGNAYQNTVNQLVEHFVDKNAFADKAIALHYVDNDAFNEMLSAADLNLNSKDVENILPANVKLADIQEEIRESFSDFTDNIIAHVPNEQTAQKLKNAYVSLATKMTVSKLLNPNKNMIGVNGVQDAVALTQSQIIGSKYEMVQTSPGWFRSPVVNVRIPVSNRELNVPTLKRIFDNPTSKEAIVRYGVGKFGVRSLDDEVNKLYDPLADTDTALFDKSIKVRNVIANSTIVTSPDDRGVMIVTRFGNNVLTLLDEDGKELVIPFTEIQDRAKFVSPNAAPGVIPGKERIEF